MALRNSEQEDYGKSHYIVLAAVVPMVPRPRTGTLKQAAVAQKENFARTLGYFVSIDFDDFINGKPERLTSQENRASHATPRIYSGGDRPNSH